MHKPSIPTKLVIAKTFEEFSSELDIYIKQNKIEEILIISGETQFSNLSSDLKNKFKNLANIDLVRVSELSNLQKKYSWIMGLGGGKVLDRAKYLAFSQEANFISVPTLIAHDGICSPVAVIENKSLGAVMPHALFVPLFVINSSPIIHIQAGVGDLIANLSAIEDWKLSAQNSKDNINDFAIMISKKSASDIIQKLTVNYLEQGSLLGTDFLRSEEFLFSLTESLALSGIAMSIAGNSRPCSGGEHLISHAIDENYGHGFKAPHGIQVLIASLYLEKFRRSTSVNSISGSLENLKTVLKFYEFPLDFKDIDISEAELKKIIEIAPKTRAGRYSILNEAFIKNH